MTQKRYAHLSIDELLTEQKIIQARYQLSDDEAYDEMLRRQYLESDGVTTAQIRAENPELFSRARAAAAKGPPLKVIVHGKGYHDLTGAEKKRLKDEDPERFHAMRRLAGLE